MELKELEREKRLTEAKKNLQLAETNLKVAQHKVKVMEGRDMTDIRNNTDYRMACVDLQEMQHRFKEAESALAQADADPDVINFVIERSIGKC